MFFFLLGGTLAWSTAYIILPVREFFSSRHFRWPTVRKDTPDPNQWLLDIAKEDAENPARLFFITDAILLPNDVDLSPELDRPYIGLGVELHNCNVHNVWIGGVTGYARFNGKELGQAIEGSRGKSSMPRGHKQVYKMRQYLSKEQAAQIHAEMVEETKICTGQRRKELRSLSLSGVVIEGECEGRDVEFALGSVERFRYD